VTDGRPAGITPSQTVGPFFAFSLSPTDYMYPPLVGDDLTTEGTVGQNIRIEGRVLDGAGKQVPDALVEIWQADGAGRYPNPGVNVAFRGFGRSNSDGAGFLFRTVKPGAVPGPDGKPQAPHINVNIFARGILKRMFTRLYFSDERNGDDPILALVPAERRLTLIARRDGVVDGAPRYVFDIRLQGENETVFFEA
jgi:protocatechuate 3,4-dioxygenase alpha subunit